MTRRRLLCRRGVVALVGAGLASVALGSSVASAVCVSGNGDPALVYYNADFVNLPIHFDCSATRRNGEFGTAAYATIELDSYGENTTNGCTNASVVVVGTDSFGYYGGPRVNDATTTGGGLTSSLANKTIYGGNWYWTRYGVYDVVESGNTVGC